MASFYDEAQAKSKHTTRVLCYVAQAVAQIPEDERTDVWSALDSPALKATAISETFLSRYGMTVAAASVQRHRRRLYGNGCQCE